MTTKGILINKFDKTAPEVAIQGNPSNWRKNITITATAVDRASGLQSLQYSLDSGKTWNVYTKGVAMKNNGWIHFRATDMVGNVTTKGVLVNKLDATAPELAISGNPTSWTNKNVTITAASVDRASGLKSLLYSLDSGKSWKTYSTAIVMQANGWVHFRATDNAGNTVTQGVLVNKIDKAAPAIAISGAPSAYTNKNVTIKATVTEKGSGLKSLLYSLDSGKSWKTYSNGVQMSANGWVHFRAIDNAGNMTTQGIRVDKIDKAAPTITISGNPVNWTKNTVNITASAADGASGIKSFQYSLDSGKSWKTYTAGSKITMANNGWVHFRATDNIGNSVTKGVLVNKIDKAAPGITVDGNPTTWVTGSVTLYATATDNGSGLKSLLYSLDSGKSWKTYSNGVLMSTNGWVHFRAIDNMGNTSTKGVLVNKIDNTAPTIKTSKSSTIWTKGNVTVKATVAEGQSGIQSFEYSTDGGYYWNTCTGGVLMTQNGIVDFRVTDKAGNTATQRVAVSNIDKEAPSISASDPYSSRDSVGIYAYADENYDGCGLKLMQYSLDSGKSWKTYNQGEYVYRTTNGWIHFRAVDKLGNLTTKGVLVNTIDRTGPTVTIHGDPARWTNNDVVIDVSATDSSGINYIMYSLDSGKTWNDYYQDHYWYGDTVITMSSSGWVHFRVYDNAGNYTTKGVQVKVDKNAPTLSLSQSVSDWTNSPVTITLKAADSDSGIYCIQYSTDYYNWYYPDNQRSLSVSSNATYYFRVYDNAGNMTEQSLCIENIDMCAPEINISTKTNDDYSTTITASASDWGSGIKSFQYSYDNVNWQDYTDPLVPSNGTVYFKAADSAGNVACSSQGITGNGAVKLFQNGTLTSALESISSGIISPSGDDTMIVYAGGIAKDTTVASGGTLRNSGGVVSGLNASAGAIVTGYGSGRFDFTSNTFIASGVAGQITDITTSNTGKSLVVSDFVVNSGMNWHTALNAEFKETIIRPYGAFYIENGAKATNVDNWGTLHLCGEVPVRTVTNSGTIHISSGGVLTLNQNKYGAVENVSSGGSAWRTQNYGTQNLYNSGVADDVAVFSGGVQNVYAGGLTSSGVVSASGIENLSGGTASSMTIAPGGMQFIYSGGTAINTQVNQGSQFVSDGGKASQTIVDAGSQFINSGGTAINNTLGGTMYTHSKWVTSSYSYTGDTVYWYQSGGSRMMVSSSWTENVTSRSCVYYYSYTGSQSVNKGGVASGTILNSGSIQTVFGGGYTSDTTVNKDAFQYVLSGGSASDIVVNNGGIITIEYDAYGENINVLDGGSIGVHGTVGNLTIAQDANFYFHMGEAYFRGYLDCYLNQKTLEALQEILPFSDELEDLYLRVDSNVLETGEYNIGTVFSTFDTKIYIGARGNATQLYENDSPVWHNGSYYSLVRRDDRKLYLKVENHLGSYSSAAPADYNSVDYASLNSGNWLYDEKSAASLAYNGISSGSMTGFLA